MQKQNSTIQPTALAVGKQHQTVQATRNELIGIHNIYLGLEFLFTKKVPQQKGISPLYHNKSQEQHYFLEYHSL